MHDAAAVTLEIVREGVVVHSVTLTGAPVHLGRALTNHVVLTDPAISAQHAALWVDGSGVWVADYASRNGTFVNDVRVRGAMRLRPGDGVWLGRVVEVRLTGVTLPANAGARAYAIEEVGGGVQHPVRSSRFRIGPLDADADLVFADAPATLLLFHTNGEVWLATDEGERALDPDEVFVVGGRHLRVREHDGRMGPTDVGAANFPYTLRVQLDSPTGALATLTDPMRGIEHRVETDNRAVLIYVLARQLIADRERGVPADDAGWCPDELVARGIWGRQVDLEKNNLHVLVHRIRKEIERAGLDPWFIEKRRKALRMRLDIVTIG
jgi:hypothetical protein